MIQAVEGSRVPYQEFRAITELMEAHVEAHQGRLRAMVAFGELVTHGGTFDIDVLEVVEGWQGGRLLVSEGTADLPLRGNLRLYLLTPDEFENPSGIDAEQDRSWVMSLLERVRRGYDIVLQIPPGYARVVLEGGKDGSGFGPPNGRTVSLADPLKLTPRADSRSG